MFCSCMQRLLPEDSGFRCHVVPTEKLARLTSGHGTKLQLEHKCHPLVAVLIAQCISLQGEEPPGIRRDIVDKPLLEATPLTMPPSAPPRSKPWHSANAKWSNLQGVLEQARPSGTAAFSADTTGVPWISSSPRRGSDGEGSRPSIHEARALLAKAAGSVSHGRASSWQVGLACCIMCSLRTFQVTCWTRFTPIKHCYSKGLTSH
jgi:hypothetical protein